MPVGADVKPTPTPWLTPQKLQAILTAVTLVAMIAGWLAERSVTAPAWICLLYTSRCV